MSNFINPLEHVKIAAPCQADWAQMFAFENERVRFCSQCNLNVYNLSGMTRSEAEALLTYTEGRLCVRFYRRSDGTILTQNCPIGLKAIKRRVAWVAQVLLGMVLSLLSGIGFYSVNVLRKQLNILDSEPVHMGVVVRSVEEQAGSEPSLRVKTRKREIEAIRQRGEVSAEIGKGKGLLKTIPISNGDKTCTNKVVETRK
jgi:hypothetical protein